MRAERLALPETGVQVDGLPGEEVDTAGRGSRADTGPDIFSGDCDMDRSMIASTTENTGSVFRTSGSCRRDDKSGQENNFLSLFNSCLESSDRPVRNPGLSGESASRRSVVKEQSRSPISSSASTADHRETLICRELTGPTGTGNETGEGEALSEVKERLGILARDGSIDLEEVAKLSDEEFAELAVWLLEGAGGQFPPVEVPSTLFGVKIIGSVPAEVVSLEGESEECPPLFSAETRKSLLAPMGEESLGMEGTAPLIDTLAGLDELSSVEAKRLASSLKEALLELAGEKGLTEGIDPDSPSGEKNQFLLDEVLPALNAEELTELLSEAAKKAGTAPSLQAMGTGKTLPEALLRHLAAQVIQPVRPGADLLAELAMTVRGRFENVQRSSASSAGTLSELLADSEGEVSSDQIKTSAEVEFTPQEVPAVPESLMETESPVLHEEAGDSVLLPDEKGEGELFDLSAQTDSALITRQEPETLFRPLSQRESLPSGQEGLISSVEVKEAGTRAPASPVTPPTQARYVDQADNLTRLTQAFKISATRGGSTATLQLSPPELGKIRLNIVIKDGLMSANVVTESKEARSVLVNQMAELRTALEQQGIKVEHFDISYSRDQEGAQQEQNARQKGAKKRQNDAGGEREVAAVLPQKMDFPARIDGGIDTVV